MKTTHITKVVAVVLTVVMLVGMIPTTVLPVFASNAGENNALANLLKGVVQGKTYTAANSDINALPEYVNPNFTDTFIDKTLSPYEPYSTDNEEHPFLPGGSAWIDLSKIYYGAPATQNFPLTKWSANTSVYNITTMENGDQAFRDLNLIDGLLWNGYASDERLPGEKGTVSSNDSHHGYPIVTAKNGVKAFAYNRYDAMQGKYGITADNHVKTLMWSPSYAQFYFNSDRDADSKKDDLYSSVLYLSDTPYLYFSTEAPDTQKIAISILIGTPVQKEITTTDGEKQGVKDPTQTMIQRTKLYEYRWYTITDNSDRPGVDAESMKNSMIPIVTVSDVVLTHEASGYTAYEQQNGDIMSKLIEAGKTDPIALAQAKGINTDTMYVDGAITGCIDFTNILPAVMEHLLHDANGNVVNRGREDVQYKIAKIRVDTKKADSAQNESAFRINYMYFGPSLVTNFTPQNTVGNQHDGQGWQYKQKDANAVGNGDVPSDTKAGNTDERAYTSGWENGAAVSVTNTPNTPNLLTVDIHGKGDGKLITWDEAKSKGATIKQGSNNSKVWMFTDNNDKVQFMEAEQEGNSGNSKHYNVMVTVPVRKWINVLGESRKISVTVTLLNNGKDSDNNVKESLKPTFVLWGNEDGSLGSGHGGVKNGGRFRNEDLVLVLAGKGQTYHCDQGDTYIAAEVDRTVGDGLFYNARGGTKESWFDVLRSPYTFDETVKGSEATAQIIEELVGYTFITSLRFTMPIDSAIQVQNMKGDGNSAGLNMYAASGSIVSAYDGGTGEQPNLNVSNTIPEKKVTITKKSSTASKPSDYTYTQSNYGDSTIKGDIKAGSAAYGPMLKESYYTIYDLLDTEFMTESSRDSHNATEDGRENQIVYGQKWKNNNANDYVPIYSGMGITKNDIGQLYGAVYPNAEFTAYARIDIKKDGATYADASWLMVGVLTKGGTPEIGWVPVSLGGTDLGLVTAGRSNDANGKAMDSGNLVAWETVKADGTETINKVTYTVFKFRQDSNNGFSGQSKVMPGATKFSNYNYTRGVSNYLKNNWALGNLQGQMASYRVNDNGTLVGMEYGTEGSKRYPYAVDIANTSKSEAYEGPTMKYANMWSNGPTATASSESLKDTYLRSVDGTDLEFGMKRKYNTSGNWSVGITRVLDTPFVAKKGDIHNCYPTMYVDYEVTKGVNNSFVIGLSVQAGDEMKLYYLYGKDSLTTDHHGASLGENFGYYSLEKIITDNPGKTIKIIGIALYMWTGSTSDKELNARIRRLEIWQEETDWLDDIVKGTWTDSEKNLGAGGTKVLDSMNLINDAFFNHHSEADDGQWNITATTTADNSSVAHDNSLTNGINFTNKGFLFQYADNTNANSYRKTNSNKGWKAYLRTDSNNDGIMNSLDDTLYSYDGYTVDGAYEYVSSVGHLRVWVPKETQTSVVFEADRSFNTNNYRYLYYSYSMRDVDTGISAEEPDTDRDDGLKPGIAMSLKQTQLGSGTSYSEISVGDVRTWAYYDANNAYWAEDGRDNRNFKTTINAAADLSTFDGIDSVNQFVFYLNNPTQKEAEYYLNYVYLSNTAPEELIKNSLEEEVYQYYYLMDNTGDRYSARFPTLDNPTGQVSGLTPATDRVNPVIVKRGARLSDASYFNGAKLYGYDGYTSGSKYQVSSTDTKTGSMKDIMFYDGYSSDLNDIPDYYTYKDMDNDGTKDIYDMTWSYGRWKLGSGESALNIMYIGEPGKDTGDGTWTADTVSGALTRRYATENYVLLRGGIEPVRYPTYYDANGGEFIYEGSDGDLQNLQKFTENSYYINSTAIQSYFNDPKAYAGMYQGHEVSISGSGTSFTNTKTNETFTATIYGVNYTSSSDTYTVTTGTGNTPYKVAKFFGSDGSQLTYSWTDKNRNGAIEYGEVFDHFYLQKPGYIFSHWEHIDTATGNSDKNFNKDGSGNVTSPDKNGARLLKYTKKGLANLDFFKAVWIVDPAFSGDNSKTYTANFFVNETDAKNNSKPFTTITTDDEGGYSKVNGKFILTMPRITNMVVDGTRILVYGWYRFDEKTQTADKSKIFSPSDKLYLLKNTKFVPATSASYTTPDGETVTLDNLFTMKVTGGQLKAITINGHEQPVTDHGVTEKPIKSNGKITGYEYSNIVANRHYRAVPIGGAKDGYGWTSVVKNANENGMVEKELHVTNTAPILSNNSKQFDFYPHENLDINYGMLTETDKNRKVFVTSTPSTNKTARTMRVYTRFYATEGATVVAAGTIRAIDPNFTNAVGLKNGKLDTASIASKMQLDPNSVTAATVKSGAFATLSSAFKAAKATSWSKFGEYYLSSTHTATTERTYYMRGFVIYQLAGSSAYHVEYSDVVGVTGVDEIVTFDTL